MLAPLGLSESTCGGKSGDQPPSPPSIPEKKGGGGGRKRKEKKLGGLDSVPRRGRPCFAPSKRRVPEPGNMPKHKVANSSSGAGGEVPTRYLDPTAPWYWTRRVRGASAGNHVLWKEGRVFRNVEL